MLARVCVATDTFDEAEKAVKDIEKAAVSDLDRAFDATTDALGDAAKMTVDLTRRGVDAGIEQVGRFGGMVLRAWKFFETNSNPPWTWRKVLFWAMVLILVAVITAIAYQFKYGILTLPIIEAAGGRFVAWMASGGALGLFGFTLVGTLFFMVIPTEPFFFLIIATHTPVAAAIVAAALGSTIGSCCNYWFGNRIRVSAGKKKPGEERKLGKWGKRAHSKSGTLLLFAGASLPLPEIIALAYGIADYPFKKFVVVTLVGRFVKWSWIAAAFLVFQFTM